MKLVIDARDAYLQRVGVAVYCRNIVKHLIECSADTPDVHMTVLLPVGSEPLWPAGSRHECLAVAPSATATTWEKIQWYYTLPGLLERLRADVYFGHVTRLPLGSASPCAVVSTFHDAASISTTGLVGGSVSRLRNKQFLRGAIQASTRIVTISRHCRQEFGEIFGEPFLSKSRVVYHGLPDEFRDMPRSPPEARADILRRYGVRPPYFISVGTVSPKKNYPRLIHALAAMKDPSAQLVICGQMGFRSDEATQAARDCGLAQRVRFVGPIPTPDVHALMSGAVAFVFPSLYEGFGLPLLEAFHVGVPALCSAATSLPEIAGDAAMLFDPRSVHSMTSCLEDVFASPEIRATLVQRGSERVKTFTWQRSAREHLDVFREAWVAKDTERMV